MAENSSSSLKNMTIMSKECQHTYVNWYISEYFELERICEQEEKIHRKAIAIAYYC